MALYGTVPPFQDPGIPIDYTLCYNPNGWSTRHKIHRFRTDHQTATSSAVARRRSCKSSAWCLESRHLKACHDISIVDISISIKDISISIKDISISIKDISIYIYILKIYLYLLKIYLYLLKIYLYIYILKISIYIYIKDISIYIKDISISIKDISISIKIYIYIY